MARRKFPPDTRLNWRDPNMPVLRYINPQFGYQQIKSEHISQFHKEVVAGLEQHPELDWKNDPTYFLKIKVDRTK